MTPREIERVKAIFIGGPLDWQYLEVAVQDSLHIIVEGQSECYLRHLFYTKDAENMLPVYVHESQEIDTLKRPKRFEALFEHWVMCMEEEPMMQNPVGCAKGLVDAALEFNARLKAVTKNYKKRIANGSSENR